MFELEYELADIGLGIFKIHEDLIHSFTFEYNPYNARLYVLVTLHSGYVIAEPISDMVSEYSAHYTPFSPAINAMKRVSRELNIYKNMVIT